MLNKKLSLAGLPAIIGSLVITSSTAFAFPVFQAQAVKPQAPKTQKIPTSTQTKTNTTVGKGGIKGGNTAFDDKGDKGPKDPKGGGKLNVGGKLNTAGNVAFDDKGDKGPKDPKGGGKLNAGGKLNTAGNVAFDDKGDKGPKDPKGGGKLNSNTVIGRDVKGIKSPRANVDGINQPGAAAGRAAGAARNARP